MKRLYIMPERREITSRVLDNLLLKPNYAHAIQKDIGYSISSTISILKTLEKEGIIRRVEGPDKIRYTRFIRPGKSKKRKYYALDMNDVERKVFKEFTTYENRLIDFQIVKSVIPKVMAALENLQDNTSSFIP